MELTITEQDAHTPVLRRVWDRFGETAQLDMLIEEAAEVIQAINKYKRFGDEKSIENLHMEIADLQICMDQLYLNFLSVEQVKENYRKKMIRLESYL